MRVWRGAMTFREDLKVSSWIYRIGRNCWIDLEARRSELRAEIRRRRRRSVHAQHACMLLAQRGEHARALRFTQLQCEPLAEGRRQAQAAFHAIP